MYRYKLITFDVTGTILKFNYPPGIHYAKAGALYGVKAEPDVLTASFKKQWMYLNSSQPNFGLKHCGWKNWWEDAVKGTFIDAGIHCDKEVLDQIAQHLINKYTTSLCWQHCEGAIELLSKLKASNIPLGIVSNFDARLETILENMNVRQYFDFVVTSYAAGYPKPDPRIFKEALKQLGKTVDPQTILHVGDTKELDCFGASEAGWQSWLITASDQGQQGLQGGSQTSGTLKELENHLLS